MTFLILGGSRSGKSQAAEQLALRLGANPVYLATMSPVDEEDEARILRHQQSRAGKGFETLEVPFSLSRAFSSLQGRTVLLESITSLLTNEMFPGSDVDLHAPDRVLADLIALSTLAANLVLVGDAPFMDLIPPGADAWTRGLAEIYRGLVPFCHGVGEALPIGILWHRQLDSAKEVLYA